MALIITPADINEYSTTIEEYSGYDRDNTVYDKQIASTYANVKRKLKLEDINVEDGEVEQDENFKYLLLSDIVYNFYFYSSYNVEENKDLIKELKDIKTDNYSIFVQYHQKGDTIDPFTLEISYTG